MKNITYSIFILLFLLFSCDSKKEIIKSNSNQDSTLLHQLKKENDSLKSAINGLNSKNADLISQLNEKNKNDKNEIKTAGIDEEVIAKGEKTRDELKKLLKGKNLKEAVKLIGKPDYFNEYTNEKDYVWYGICKEPVTGKSVDFEMYFYKNDSFEKFGH